ncbi:TIGR03905 family TSCPD domain-containing protein [Treponema endosymbiont of Eucomonympha sp.]|uniref:TIGR03905 family TSCPD domain-containing protein n=1 Tax=Treponema endosymbiont of Eucomonympha sp. TaxID=1580831 RepID=UPI000784C609|nr:TIGR03905 family TSCPD domain-containing protein [Treponema endosymbiont of Eucomonympha sp.]
MTKLLHGTCATSVTWEVEDGRLHNVVFADGCNGNLKGISRLVEGLTPKEVVERLKGVLCGDKGTSCPDQFARILEQSVRA